MVTSRGAVRSRVSELLEICFTFFSVSILSASLHQDGFPRFTGVEDLSPVCLVQA